MYTSHHARQQVSPVSGVFRVSVLCSVLHVVIKLSLVFTLPAVHSVFDGSLAQFHLHSSYSLTWCAYESRRCFHGYGSDIKEEKVDKKRAKLPSRSLATFLCYLRTCSRLIRNHVGKLVPKWGRAFEVPSAILERACAHPFGKILGLRNSARRFSIELGDGVS